MGGTTTMQPTKQELAKAMQRFAYTLRDFVRWFAVMGVPQKGTV